VVDEAGVVAVVDGEGRIVTAGQGRRWVRRQQQQRGGSGEGKGVGRKGGKKGGGTYGRGVERVREAEGKGRDTGLLGKDVEWRRLWSEGTDAVMDVPIGGVCEILYGGWEGVGES